LRVPVRSLIAFLEAGHPLHDFVDEVRDVSRERSVAALRLANQLLRSPVA
jgi:uncharacterized protein (DUF433 family)